MVSREVRDALQYRLHVDIDGRFTRGGRRRSVDSWSGNVVVVMMVVMVVRGTLRGRRGPVKEVHRGSRRAVRAASHAGFFLGLVAVMMVTVDEN